jgi:hypothetical protein
MEKILKFSGFERMYEDYGFVFEASSIVPKPTKPQDSVVNLKTGQASQMITNMLAVFGGPKKQAAAKAKAEVKAKGDVKAGAKPAAKPKVLEEGYYDEYDFEEYDYEMYESEDLEDSENWDYGYDGDDEYEGEDDDMDEGYEYFGYDLIEEKDGKKSPNNKAYLKLNDKGPIVKKIKELLDLESKTDVFDRELEQEVIEFKKDEKFPKVDGVVGDFAFKKMLASKGIKRSRMRKALTEFINSANSIRKNDKGAKPAAKGGAANILKLNSKGDAVKRVQSALDIDQSGTFDKATEEEVVEFKKDEKYKKVDGTVGVADYQKMLASKGIKRSRLKRMVAEFTKLLGASAAKPGAAKPADKKGEDKKGAVKGGAKPGAPGAPIPGGNIAKSGALYGLFSSMTIISINGSQYVVSIPTKDAAAKLAPLKKTKDFVKRFGWLMLVEKAAGKALIFTTEGTAISTTQTADAMNNMAITSSRYAKAGTMSALSSMVHGLAQVQKWNTLGGVSKKLSAGNLNAGNLWTGYVTSCTQALKASASGMYALLCAMRASLAPMGKEGGAPASLAMPIFKPYGKSLGLNWQNAKNTAEAKIAAGKVLNAKKKTATRDILVQVVKNHKLVQANSTKGAQAALKVVSKFGQGPKAGVSASIKSTQNYLNGLVKWTDLTGGKPGAAPTKPGAAPTKPGAAPAKPGTPAAKPAAPAAAKPAAAPAKASVPPRTGTTSATKGRALNPNLTARR